MAQILRYEYEGKTYSLRQLSALFGIKYHALYGRINKGMDIQDAMKECINTPSTWQGLSGVKRMNIK